MTITEQLNRIGDSYGIRNILEDESMTYPIPEIKWCIWFILYNRLGYSYPRISQLFIKYSHQGIQYGVKKIKEKLIYGDIIIKKRVEKIEEDLKENV